MADKPEILDLDLDGVCADYTEAMRQHVIGKGLRPADWHPSVESYALDEHTGWPFKDYRDYRAAHMEAEANHLYATMPVIPGAPEALQRLSDEGVYIRVVTHRLFVSGQHRIVVSDTARWLDDNRIPYMSLCFTGLKDTMHATLHLDDSPANVEALRAADEHVAVFNQPYNRNLPEPRIRDWSKESVDMLLGLLDRYAD